PPTITFNTPSSNVTVNQGDPYSIVVTTQDLEDAVQLMVWVDPDGTDNNGNEIQLLNQLLPYSAATQNQVTTTIVWPTAVTPGIYRVLGQVDDKHGHVQKAAAGGTITVMPAGTGQQDHPPSVLPSTPATDAGLS